MNPEASTVRIKVLQLQEILHRGAAGSHRLNGFICIDVEAYGKEHDGSVFAQSVFVRDLEAGCLDFPRTQGRELTFVFTDVLWG